MKQFKVGILGEIRSGKDTVAKMLVQEFKKVNCARTDFYAFSTGIHEVIKMTMPELYSDGKPRFALQHIGQSLREVKPDVWIDYLLNSSDYVFAELAGRNIIVTDVRQANEAKRLQEEGYTIIKVTASQEARMARAEAEGDNFDSAMFNHETEKSVHECPFDYLIDNSSTLFDLKRQVHEVVRQVATNV